MVSMSIHDGLGNILFQIAMIFSFSLKHGVDYCVPLTNTHPHYKGQKPYIFPGIKYCDSITNLPFYKEKSFTYEEIPFKDNVCFRGFFQSYKYFYDYRDQIVKAFGFEWQMKKDWVSLHLRRGDYLQLEKYFPVVSMEYISMAINYYTGKGYKNFTVFSDGIEYCIENINSDKFPECNFEYSQGRTELEDMGYASCHQHQIGSNSTFSIWQHILNQNPDKIGVFPKTWFGVGLRHDTKDLLPPNTITL